MTIVVYFLFPLSLVLFQRLDRFKIYRLVVFAMLVLFFGLRSLNVGTDTILYFRMYQNILLFSKEPGYLFLMKVANFVHLNYNAFLVLVGVIIYGLILISIKEYSKSFSLSVFCLICLGFFASSMNVMRQYLAIAISFFAFRYIQRGQILKYILFILLAAMFHFSSLAMVLYYPLLRLLRSKRVLYFFLIAMLPTLLVFFVGKLHLSLLDILGYGHYLETKYVKSFTIDKPLLGTIILRVVPNLVTLFFLLRYDEQLKSDDYHNEYIVSAMAISLFASFFTSLGEVFYRAFQYFWIYSIIAIPNVISKISLRQRALAQLLIVFALLVYHALIIIRWGECEVVPYVFCF